MNIIKKKHSNAFKISFAIAGSGLIFAVFIFGYLKINLKPEKSPADVKNHSVPYAQEEPENCGLRFDFTDGNAAIIYLDFVKKSIAVIGIDNSDESENEYCGYPINYHFRCDHLLISDIIDIIGGIELTDESGNALRYTGIQVTEQFLTAKNTSESQKQIIDSILKQISKNGITTDDLIYIIDNCETDLTVPDCYYWSEYLEEMCMRVSYIN